MLPQQRCPITEAPGHVASEKGGTDTKLNTSQSRKTESKKKGMQLVALVSAVSKTLRRICSARPPTARRAETNKRRKMAAAVGHQGKPQLLRSARSIRAVLYGKVGTVGR